MKFCLRKSGSQLFELTNPDEKKERKRLEGIGFIFDEDDCLKLDTIIHIFTLEHLFVFLEANSKQKRIVIRKVNKWDRQIADINADYILEIYDDYRE